MSKKPFLIIRRWRDFTLIFIVSLIMLVCIFSFFDGVYSTVVEWLLLFSVLCLLLLPVWFAMWRVKVYEDHLCLRRLFLRPRRYYFRELEGYDFGGSHASVHLDFYKDSRRVVRIWYTGSFSMSAKLDKLYHYVRSLQIPPRIYSGRNNQRLSTPVGIEIGESAFQRNVRIFSIPASVASLAYGAYDVIFHHALGFEAYALGIIVAAWGTVFLFVTKSYRKSLRYVVIGDEALTCYDKNNKIANVIPYSSMDGAYLVDQHTGEHITHGATIVYDAKKEFYVDKYQPGYGALIAKLRIEKVPMQYKLNGALLNID
jgi:hypothetical protein